MARLGKHKTGKSCLYIKRLDDVDRECPGAIGRRLGRTHAAGSRLLQRRTLGDAGDNANVWMRLQARYDLEMAEAELTEQVQREVKVRQPLTPVFAA